jgi:hypothetical protein
MIKMKCVTRNVNEVIKILPKSNDLEAIVTNTMFFSRISSEDMAAKQHSMKLNVFMTCL